jgi:hypothetical protein
MLPDHFPGKDDVVQSIFLALVEGRLDRSQVERHVRRFVREYNRQHPTKFAKFGNSLLVSLDEQIFDDGTTTRGGEADTNRVVAEFRPAGTRS